MKKILIIFCCLMSLMFCAACGDETENLSEQIKVEVVRDVTTEGNKMMDITYPTVGGLESTRALSTINSSISNYVEIQLKEFNNALSGEENTNPIDSNFDATVTKQITPVEKEEEESVLDPSENTENSEEDQEESDSQENANDEEDSEEDGSQTTDGTPITLTMDFDITYHHDNIFNIIESYEKVLGDDKNYNGQQSFVFDLNKGAPVSLGEIYDFESDFPSYVDEKISKTIADTPGVRKDTSFYINEETKTLCIFYNALEISPEKNFIPTFEFTLKELSPYLNEEYKGRLD
ncbi:MAG: hypothetical protein Q4C00_07675 [Bacillota bacterium]|nr:hypothetical protein [Bacillota bacterium]